MLAVSLLPRRGPVGQRPALRVAGQGDAAEVKVGAKDPALEVVLVAGAVGLVLAGAAADPHALGPLPGLAADEKQQRGHEDDAPLPRDAGVLEDDRVNDGDIKQREDGDETGHDAEKEELVAPHVPEPLRKVLCGLGLHAEEGPAHVQHLPGEEEREPRQGGKGGGAGAVDGVAGGGVAVVAVGAEVAVAKAEHDEQEGGQAQRGRPQAVGKHVCHELPGEDACFHLFCGG